MPANVAVPLPLSTNVTPLGNAPVSVRVEVGVPVVVTENVPAVPTPKVADTPAAGLFERLGFHAAAGIGEAGWGRTLLAAVVSIIYFFPVLWIILTAFKTYDDVLAVPAKFIFTPTLENFAQVFSRAYSVGGQAQDTGFTLYFFNSIFIAIVSIVLALVIGTLAAYGFSRYPLKGNDTYLFIILSTRMLPAIVVIIPIFIMFRVTGLAGTYLGIIALYTAFNFSRTRELREDHIHLSLKGRTSSSAPTCAAAAVSSRS